MVKLNRKINTNNDKILESLDEIPIEPELEEHI
jgi:hypothetical protein